MHKIIKNKVFNFTIKNFSFGTLSPALVIDILKDGRVASHFLEPQLTHWFPELTHIKGCKGYDHIDQTSQKYDAKNFTSRGLKFMPSNQLGSGRNFCYETTYKHAAELVYICCDIIDFPQVKVIFKDGPALLEEYPKATITKTKRKELFCE